MAELMIELLQQSIQLPNSRSVGLSRARWGKDADEESIPELQLNMLLLGEAFVLLLATGIGTLALLWATVVLLGGFSTVLLKTDFWFTTAIIFIETAGVVGYNTQPASKFFIDVPAAFAEMGNLGFKTAKDLAVLVIMGPVFITAAPVFAASGCITLSIMRLVAIKRHDYGDSIADASKVNLKPALILFYALVLTQGILFLNWMGLTSSRRDLVDKAKAQLELEESDLVERYTMGIIDTCIDRGVSSTINRNFVSFAGDLLQSEHSADHVCAVTLLHALILQEKRAAGVLEQIRSSQQSVDRLVLMLRPMSSINGKPKAYTADIVAKLASHLRLVDMPGSTSIISSLLDPTLVNIQPQTNQVPEDRPCLMPQTNQVPEDRPCLMPPNIQIQTDGVNDLLLADRPRPRRFISFLFISPFIKIKTQINILRQIIRAKKEARNVHSSIDDKNRWRKPLIVHGLLILAELAGDPDNCTEISNTTGLVAKITAPLTHGLHTVTGNDDDTSIEIVKASLAVVAKLVSGRGKTSRDVAKEIMTSDSRTVDNIIWILKNSSDVEMKIAAVQILTNLTLDEAREFITVLRRLFFDPRESSLGLAAGQALVALLVKDHGNCKMVIGEQVGTEYPVIQQLVTVMCCDENSEEYRAAAAESLAQICTNDQISANPGTESLDQISANSGTESLDQISANSETESLDQICTNSTTEDGNLLAQIGSALSMVLKAIVGMESTMQLLVPQNPQDHEEPSPVEIGVINVIIQQLLNECTGHRKDVQNQPSPRIDDDRDADLHRRKLLGSLIGLVMHICNRLTITVQDFEAAVAGIPLQMDGFVKTLKGVVQKTSKYPEEVDSLVIIRNTSKLAAWMMQQSNDSIRYFRQEDILGELRTAAKAMVALDRYMILSGGAHEGKKSYETLSALVGKVEALIPQVG